MRYVIAVILFGVTTSSSVLAADTSRCSSYGCIEDSQRDYDNYRRREFPVTPSRRYDDPYRREPNRYGNDSSRYDDYRDNERKDGYPSDY